ncbi:hypothetical protein [Breoghania sp.]|uniref:hypothetical protein n=1 Tax=Breoghania sp. TaxID=2065378 RepID=UPI00260990CC|nr:hypothetical protein [Breoghania sp.]MDJ0932488.1 hypothetical protein [Breoghania sp.]
MTQAAERLSRLVRDLLAFSRESERGYASDEVDLKPLIQEVLGDLALLIRENDATVTLRDLPQLTGDAVPLQRLFYNLILNALKYPAPGRGAGNRDLCPHHRRRAAGDRGARQRHRPA